MENTVQENYITEQLWLPLLAGAIQLYFGAPNIREWLPDPDSAIPFSDFPSVDVAYAYVAEVMNKKELWSQHSAWCPKQLPLKLIYAARHSSQNFACNMDSLLP